MGVLFDYLSSVSAISVFVLIVLSAYFIMAFWVFIDRFYSISKRISLEGESLRGLYFDREGTVSEGSIIHNYLLTVKNPGRAIMQAALSDSVRISTKGLTWLSIIASTSPFIGLFGTVVGILETFSSLGSQSSASLSVVAPAISEALIATAAGISVAIFAYTFHLVLKRRAYELSSLLASQSEILLSKEEGR